MMMDAKISVIIPCYNQEKYIGEAIDSALEQTLTPYEVIVINDGSTDLSEQIINLKLQKSNLIKYLSQDNAGVSRARNAGIDCATGDYVVFLDGDDTLTSRALEKMAEEFIRDSSTVLAYGDAHTYGKPEEVSNMPAHFTLEDILQGNKLFITAMVKREDLGEDVRFENTLTKANEDWEFWIQLIAKYENRRRVKISYPIFNYRQDENSKTLGLKK